MRIDFEMISPATTTLNGVDTLEQATSLHAATNMGLTKKPGSNWVETKHVAGRNAPKGFGVLGWQGDRE